MKIEIPGGQPLELANLLLDFNGTLARAGEISAATKSLLEKIAVSLKIYVATSDTRGNAAEACSGLPVKMLALPGGMAADAGKLDILKELGEEKTAAIGNGRNDALMLSRAALGICVLGGEGAHKAALAAADVLTGSIENALLLLAEPVRLVATFRN